MNCAGNGKDETVHYSYSITQDEATGWHIVELTAGRSGDPASTISVKVSPEAGSNMFSLVAGGHELIDATDDLASLPSGGRGNFLLYPTPNRVRDGEFSFMEQDILDAQTGGEKT